jgi:phage terminase large subunit GpA-like protein
MWSSLTPSPKLKLSDWIERNVSAGGSIATTGVGELRPFQRKIADAIGDPATERVTLVKPVRVGFTTLPTDAMASFCSNDPGTDSGMRPIEADCRDYVVSDIEPIFVASPILSNRLSGDRNILMGFEPS